MVDLKLAGGASGLACVQTLHAHDPDMLIVVLTGYASIATAVEAIKLGACHYLAKPSNTDDIEAAFGRAEGNAEVELTERADLDQDAGMGAHPRDAGRDRLQHLRNGAPAGHAPAHAGAQAGEAAGESRSLLVTSESGLAKRNPPYFSFRDAAEVGRLRQRLRFANCKANPPYKATNQKQKARPNRPGF